MGDMVAPHPRVLLTVLLLAPPLASCGGIGWDPSEDDDVAGDDDADDDVGDDDGADDDVGDDDGADDDVGDDDATDDDVGDDDATDDDVGDDDTADDDVGDDDTGANPLIGSIYVQSGGVGYASYHFDAPNDVYIDYTAFPAYQTMDNGLPFPAHKQFVDKVYDIPQRTFEATIDWQTPENTTVDGAAWWDYRMEFSQSYDEISGGWVKAYAANGTLLSTYYYQVHLFYDLY